MSEGIQPIRLTDEQRLDWLRLIRSQNVGPRTFRALLNHFGGARAALEALPGLARRGGGASGPQICSREQAEREIEACAKLGISLVALGEADYPQRLQMIDDAPPLLAIRGHAGVLTMPFVAIGIAPASRPVPLRSSPAAKIASIRPSTSSSSTRFSRPAQP